MNKFFLLVFISVFIQIEGKLECGKNEEFNDCGRICEQTCSGFKQKTLECDYDKTECNKNTADCRCSQGFLRDRRTGSCVRPHHCSKCDYGETELLCGKICEASCLNPIVPKVCNHAICAQKDCRCHFEAGFVRDHVTGECVLLKNCSQKSLL